MSDPENVNSTRFQQAIGPHIVALLRAGVSVVLDFHASTIASRAWMRELFESAGSDHLLHYLDVADEDCLQRLHLRNAGGSHDYLVSDEDFVTFTKHFVPLPKPKNSWCGSGKRSP